MVGRMGSEIRQVNGMEQKHRLQLPDRHCCPYFLQRRAQMETHDGLNVCMKKAVELISNVELWYREEDQFQTKLL